jgi:hypothetical protein
VNWGDDSLDQLPGLETLLKEPKRFKVRSLRARLVSTGVLCIDD